MPITLGIDVGSLTTKSVVLKDGVVSSHSLLPSGENVQTTVEEVVNLALGSTGMPLNGIDRIASTGIGKDFVSYSGKLLAEARCGVAGVRFYYPSIKGVIDIGAERTRVAKCNAKGRMVDFESNDKCASGTGIFLDTMSSLLQIRPWDSEALHKVEQGEINISSTCAVFAESEVISLIHKGMSRFDIWMAISTSVASKVYVLVNRLSLDSDIAIIGGVAKNPVFIFCLENMLGCKLLIPPDPEFITALGAAIIAAESET